jgi:hypothetical protein
VAPPLAVTPAIAPQEAVPTETTSAPQLKPVPGRTDRAVGSAPSGAMFGQPATDIATSTSPTMLPPLQSAAAPRGDVAGKLNPPADTARPVARRPAAAIAPGAVADEVLEPPLRAIPPGALSQSIGQSATSGAGTNPKSNSVGSSDGTATGGRRASGNVTVPTLALPGLSGMKALAENKPDEKQISRVEAIISSMTPEERRKQHIINGSRRKRIAKGSGTSVEEVNRLLKQFVQMQKMLKSLGGLAGIGGGGKKARRQAMQMLRNRR